jgi:hypothetical protein
MIIASYNYNMQYAITSQPMSQKSFRSEFRSPLDLQELLQHRQHWKK